MEAQTNSCQNCKKDFTMEPDDFGFYEKIKVPLPTFCPECRYQRRISGRNEWELYNRNCSLCNSKMVSIYNPEYPGLVYCLKCFWGDKWDPLEYGVDFDFSRPFFEQWDKMRARVPKVTVAHFRCVNSEYTNQSQDLKNCYLIFASDSCENCMYGSWYGKSKECLDSTMISHCEFLYEGINCSNCSNSMYLEDCSDCIDSYFLKDCRGCISCFGCTNLRSQKYCWFNEQLTKEEYEKHLDSFIFSRKNIEDVMEKHKALNLSLPVKYYRGANITKTIGNYVRDTKNTKHVFNILDGEDSSYSQDAWWIKSCMDVTEMGRNEFDYEVEGVGFSSSNICVSRSWNIFNSMCSQNCFSCNFVFGCASLHKKEYCILNKQYSKEEYLALKEKIIEHMKKTGEWGQFFPTEISLFAYNETVAQTYFPMIKEQVLAKGWKWYERDARNYQVTKKYSDLPTTIEAVDDSILNEVISCSSQGSEELQNHYTSCTTAFRITSMELMLYRKLKIPLPEKCFPCRFKDRLNRRPPRKLWHRSCMCMEVNHQHKSKCLNEFETSYSSDRPEKVYCESCYNKEVY